MITKQHTLGPYHIQRTIGRGLTEVYLAHHPVYGQVALKVIPPFYGRHREMEERFRREAQMLKRMRHPNVLRIYDAGTIAAPNGGRYYFLAAEYLADGSLCNLLQRHHGRLSEPGAVAIAVQIADALAYVHRNGIIHRDIKPNNILLRGNQAILCDFGVSRALAEATITQDRQLLGTLSYMSPEQTLGDRRYVRRGSDIYSFGVVLYEILSGHQPRNNPHLADAAVLAMIQRNPLPPLRQVAPHVSPEVAAIVDKCVQTQRQLRYDSMDEVAGALRQAMLQRGHRLQAPPLVPDVLPERPGGINISLIIAVSIGIVLIGLVVLLLYVV